MAERHKWYIIQSKCFRKEGECFEEIRQTKDTMAGVGLFVIVCLGMVVVAGKKDDQTETIEQLNQTISEQSRRIMNTEGQLARYKRELAEATGKNEA